MSNITLHRLAAEMGLTPLEIQEEMANIEQKWAELQREHGVKVRTSFFVRNSGEIGIAEGLRAAVAEYFKSAIAK